ncbi:hypothetical protein HpBHB32_14030 [Helicobacter pylori]
MNPIKTNTQGAWQSLALTLDLKFLISFNNGAKNEDFMDSGSNQK